MKFILVEYVFVVASFIFMPLTKALVVSSSIGRSMSQMGNDLRSHSPLNVASSPNFGGERDEYADNIIVDLWIRLDQKLRSQKQQQLLQEESTILNLWDRLTRIPQPTLSTRLEDEDIAKSWQLISQLRPLQDESFGAYVDLMRQRQSMRGETMKQTPASMTFLGPFSTKGYDFNATWQKAQLTFKQVRELEASGKYEDNSFVQGDSIPVVEKILVQVAAKVGKDVGKVFGGHEPYNYVE